MARQLLQSEPGICAVGEREGGKKRERERERGPGERETSEEVERGWYGAGQWLGGHLGEEGPARQKEEG